MKIYMLAILDKAKPDTENTRRSNSVVVRHMNVEVTKLPLYPELILVGHNLLYHAWIESDLIYIYCVYTEL
jgi:hypothetical protein